MGSSDSSLSLSSCREDSVRTGLVGDTGKTGGEDEVEKEVEGDSASWESPSASFVKAALLPVRLAEKESMSPPGAPG